MKNIEILGSGCMKCDRLEKNTRKAVEELGLGAEISKVQDVGEISSRGVVMTPALVVDGKVLVTGKVPSSKKIKSMLQG